MLETNDSCEYNTNYICWEDTVGDLNKQWETLMIPVEVMMLVFMVVGIFGNVLVLLVYSLKRQKSTATIFIMYLASIDLAMCIVLHPYIIYKLFNNYNQTWSWLCKLFEYVNHCSLSVSGFMLLLISIDRYLAICRPVKFLLFGKHVAKLIAVITVGSVITSLPILEFYGATPVEAYELNSSFTGFKCHFRQQYLNSDLLTAYGALVMSAFLFEIVLIVILYKNVAVTAYRSRRTVSALSNAHVLAGIKPSTSNSDSQIVSQNRGQNTSNMSSVSSQINMLNISDVASRYTKANNIASMFSVDTKPQSTNIQKSEEINRMKNRGTTNNNTENRNFSSRLKAAKILFLVTAVYFLSWMPFLVMRLCYTINTEYWQSTTKVRYQIENFLNHMFYLNNAANPIIYTIINKNFRADCKTVLRNHFRSTRVFALR